MLRGNRKILLRSAVANPAASFAPTDIASLKAWWDFSHAASVYEDTGATDPAEADDGIAYLADRTASGLHLTQGTAGARPTWKAAIQNGLSIGRHDGGDVLTRASVTGSALFANDAGTVFMAFSNSSADSIHTPFRWSQSLNNFVSLYAPYSDNTFYFDFGKYDAGGRISVAQPGGWDDAWHILCLHRSGTAGKIYVDGGAAILSGTFSDDLDNTQSGTLGLGAAGSGDEMTGDYGECLVFNEGLSVANLNAVGSYLATKWSLTWSTVS